MRKRLPIALLCVVLSISVSSCRKSAGTDSGNVVLIDNDTQTIQSQLNTGDVTLEAGKTYHVTGLKLTHSLDLNGATINLITNNPYSYAITVSAPGVRVSNGTITGSWNNQTAGNPAGYGAINITAAKCSVSHVNISAFSSYGIYSAAVDSTSVTYCSISNTGYIGFFFNAENAVTAGGTFSNNTVDRSMLPPATIQQMAIGIRGNLSNSSITTSGWVIANNTIKMPVNPTDLSAQGMELRRCNNTLIESNTTTSGAIGISMVDCSGNTVKGNTCNNVSQEGIEYANCQSCTGQNNIISGSGAVGELIDGDVGSNNVQITGDKISGTGMECIQAYYQTKNLTISACTLSVSSPNTFAINLQKTSLVKVINCDINGNGIGNAAVQLDNCPGNLTITGGAIASFKSSLLYIYNSTPGLVTDNINVSGVKVSSVPQGFTYVLDNGGLLGSNIHIAL
ncbi:right-handed parallel beta-helix repeat-containing protein [Mucilaginibacter sp.]|jgi:parallel beta-helix repeat protein|uniref:right-handed parallel beta-helix repeat-containing protein n=1 Tax=Mucilaginibacter sp. TaxID=1882438 RepID=UPI002C7DCA92|nr:right-handed parallel beta-helix repeat-containing protein [Mucilaginibacter sp.]HTI59150.1 right-handed parallel beta-helix repeat-containing protein [Mucilaginibacter sp.]